MDIKYGRKRRGIKRQLHKVIEEWIESIQDEEVRKLCRLNTIVTGGSIASMLLGEQINDYDIYFRNKETAIKVTEYYIEEFNKRNSLEVKAGVIPYKPQIKLEDTINLKGETEERVSIFCKSAGIASEGQEEYDYFESATDQQLVNFSESLAKSYGVESEIKDKFRPVFLSQNAITLSDKIQIIIRFFGEPDKIHSNYDFAHAMCYWDHQYQNLVMPAEALECLLSRTLIYRGSLYPIASIFRMKKFLERGWRISAGQQLKIMWQISEIDLTDIETVKDQLTGVDLAYLFEVITELNNSDPSSIDSTYVAEIIDRIFD